MSSFQIYTCCQAHNPMGRVYPDTGTRTSEDVFYLLAIRGPKRGEGMLEICSQALYAPVAGGTFLDNLNNSIAFLSMFSLSATLPDDCDIQIPIFV